MTQPLQRLAALFHVALLVAVIACLPACKPRLTEEEKATRAELRQALRERAFPRAVELAQRVVGSSPRDGGAWERLVRAQLGAGDLDGAKESITQWRAIVWNPSPKLDELTGNLAARQNDDALALQAWSKAVARDPKNARVYRKIARLHHRAGRWAEEDAAYTAVLAIEENGADLMQRALCRRRLHRWSEALDDHRRARELAPDDPDVRRGAKLFERVAKFLAEIRELDARLAVTPTDDQLLADRALLFLRSQDAELALADSEAAAKLAPWALRPRLFRALALVELGRTAELDPLEFEQSLRLEDLSPEFLESVARLDSEISVEPDNAEALVSRAWHLNDIGQPQLALADAEKALRIDPRSSAAAVECGYALAKLGRTEEAFAQIASATDSDPRSATAWQYRGELEMSRGDPDAAIASLTRALAISQTAEALQKREQCYRQIGIFAKADEDRRALEELTGRGAPK